MIHDPGNEPDSIVRSPEGLVVAIAQKQREWFCMAVGTEKISEAVIGETEGVHLAIGESLHP